MTAEPVWTVGLMSGTSMDGIDAAMILTDGETVSEFGPGLSVPYDDDMRKGIRSVLGREVEDSETVTVEREVTLLHARAVKQLISEAGQQGSLVSLIGFHGQTITHLPQKRFTWQLGDGALLARETGLPVVFDFRKDDVLAGGEGAPLAPVYHSALAAGLGKPAVLLNIGGVSNVTFAGADGRLLAFDTGPGNALMDDLVLSVRGQPYDAGGAIAAQGRADESRLAKMLAHPYFDRLPPKSLDRLDFNGDAVAGMGLEDALATLCAFTAASIARAAAHFPARPESWIVCGGGRHNATLMAMLSERLDGTVKPAESLGADGDMIEAQAFALMAVRRTRDLPISFPSTTNAPRPMTGGRVAHP